MLRLAIYIALVVGGLVTAAAPASAQCTDSRITTGFQKTVGRAPSATDCNNLAAASKVCQDPWIAQAFYVLSVSSSPGLLLNGHSPMQYDNGRPTSTLGECNSTNYGSWPDFATLVSNVYRYLHPAAAPAASFSVSLGLPGVIQNAQAVPISWTYSGTPSNCGSGLALMLYNVPGVSQYTWSRLTSLTAARSATVQMLDWSKSLNPGQYSIQVALVDLCSGSRVSGAYSVTLNIPAPATTSPAAGTFGTIQRTAMQTATPAASTTVALRMLSDGSLVDGTGTALPNTKGSYYLSVVNGQIFAVGGGSYVAWVKGPSGNVAVMVKPGAASGLLVDNYSSPYRIVAGGGGNFQVSNSYGTVAEGGGNIILNGGGNIVAGGGGNIVAGGGGNIALPPQQALAQTVAGVISNDGGSLIGNDSSSLNAVTLARLASSIH